MKPYTRKYPPDPPRQRTVWLLILLVAALLVANLAHQTGVV